MYAKVSECKFGGEGGIRTLGTVTRTPVFETGLFNHSSTSPAGHWRLTLGGSPGRAGTAVRARRRISYQQIAREATRTSSISAPGSREARRWSRKIDWPGVRGPLHATTLAHSTASGRCRLGRVPGPPGILRTEPHLNKRALNCIGGRARERKLDKQNARPAEFSKSHAGRPGRRRDTGVDGLGGRRQPRIEAWRP
jgi:hypothetical protein